MMESTISMFPIKEEPELTITSDGVDDMGYINDYIAAADGENHSERGPVKINYEPFINKIYDKFKTRFYQCYFCSRSYPKKHSLKLHIRSIHMLLKPFPCKICTKSFTAKNVLVQHIRIHSGERPYVCPICSKTFVQHSVWNRHKRAHTKETPHKCDVCLKAFAERSALHQHMKIHTEDRIRRYKCELCNDSFLKRSHLNRHLTTKSHLKRELAQDDDEFGEGKRHFSCELCNVSFAKKSHLARHNASKKHQKVVAKCGSALNVKLEME